jgi:NodT family efflux transporter outer membrane factor (OMF) lipoprotein
MKPSIVLSALALAACNLAPDYHRPELSSPTPAVFKEAGDWAVSVPNDTAPKGAWWEMFHDPVLDDLEGRVATSNQDLKAAMARLDEARALSQQADADLTPTVGAGVTAERSRQSPNGADFNPASSHKETGDHALNVSFSYELDVFGRVRNSIAAADATEQASAGDLAALDLRLRAELATDYFALRGADARQALLDDTVTTYQKAVDLTEQRLEGKIGAELDLAQARTQLESARTDAADIRLQRAELEHAIAVLVGVPASDFSVPPSDRASPPVPQIAVGLPSTLLQRRPDVAAAERRVAAANAEIGVARAAYYPTFSLDGLLGLEAKSPNLWMQASSMVWAIGGSAAETIYDGGRIDGLNAEARAKFDETAANYRKTVLVAYQEVEDQLAAVRQLQQETQTNGAAVKAAGRALDLSLSRYREGLVTYLQVVSAQTTALGVEEAAIDLRTRDIDASILLVRALGGGWSDEQLNRPDVQQASQ